MHSGYQQHRGEGPGTIPGLEPTSTPRDIAQVWPCKPRRIVSSGRRYIFAFTDADFVPELPPPSYPHVCIDFRLGAHEPMLYPQLWKPHAPHMAWMEKVEPHRELNRNNLVGYVFQPHDWEAIFPSAAYGRVSPALLHRLKEAFWDIHSHVQPLMATAKTRLLLPTSTITECISILADLDTLVASARETAHLVTRLQRGIAELRAFRLFRLDVKHRVGDAGYIADCTFSFVGVFTTDRSMVELLHRLGVPVWYIADTLPESMRGIPIRPADSCARVVELRAIEVLDGRGLDHLGHQYARSISPPVEEDGMERQPTPEPEPGHTEPSARSTYPRSRSPVHSARRRSRSPTRRGQQFGDQQTERARRRSPPPSNVPRYMLHEQGRISEGNNSRRHPDAPAAWLPRTWATDPGHQAARGFKLPDWAPHSPTWLSNISAGVDQSVTREFRLCAPDVMHPVPQDRFAQPLVYTLPPLHFLLKHEKRLQYVLRSWAALRDFWLRRILREGFCGLPAATWRKVLDDKYHMSPALASWIGQHVSKGTDGSGSLHVAQSAGESSLRPDAISGAGAQQQDDAHVPAAGTSYTRAAVLGEDLPVRTSRDSTEPANWRTSRKVVFYEREARCMYRLDAAARDSVVQTFGQWLEFWDYENGRILLFEDREHVQVEVERAGDVEMLLNEGSLRWYLSTADEDGLAPASRVMWKAQESILQSIEIHLPSSSGVPGGVAAVQCLPDAPPPDAVYGYEPELPNGQSAQSFYIRQQRLSREELTTAPVRALLIWELQEAMFRFQLRDLDTYILTSLGLWSPSLRKERETLWVNCWGGQDGFVPSGLQHPPLTQPRIADRKWAIYNFWKIVRAWPRCREVANLRGYTTTEGLSLETLELIEREVWAFYAQTFLDYFGILATLPTCMPENPFVMPH